MLLSILTGLVSGLLSLTTPASSSVMVIMLPLPSVSMDFGRETLSGGSGATQNLQPAQYHSNTSSYRKKNVILLWIARELNPFLAINVCSYICGMQLCINVLVQ